MNTHTEKANENKSQAVAHAVSQKQSNKEPSLQLEDNRPEAVQMQKLQEMANDSPQVKQLKIYQAMADNHTSKTAQRKENNTGLPDNLKAGVENLSGFSMDDVKVHYNSDKPAQLNAHAYAQGTDIHVASGQEKHLAHEAWHVVQQKQGRVQPTMQMKGSVNVNDDAGLETEADVMGEKALGIETKQLKASNNYKITNKNDSLYQLQPVIQRAYYYWDESKKKFEWTKHSSKYAIGYVKYTKLDGSPIMVNAEGVEDPSGTYDSWILATDLVLVRAREAGNAVGNALRDGADRAAIIAEANGAGPLIDAGRGIARAAEPLLQDVQHGHYGAAAERIQGAAMSYYDALKAFWSQSKLQILLGTLAGVVLGGGMITLGLWLNTLTWGAPYLGITSFTLTSLYSLYLIYRWVNTELIPVFTKPFLVGINSIILMTAIGKTLFDVIQGVAFRHMIFAAIPFALVLEHIITKVIEKIEAIKNAHNEGEAGEDQAQV